MTTLERQVLKLCLEEYSVKEIEELLQIDAKRLLRILKQLHSKGYFINAKYYSNGNIKLYGKNNLQVDEAEIKLLSNKLKILVISDTHYGSIYERCDLVDKVFNYGVSKGYNIVIHGGDFIEGLNDNNKKSTKHRKIENQARYALEKYPYDKNVTHFMLLGNHDKTNLKIDSFNLENLIKSTRLDIFTLGYGASTIKVGKDSILVFHRISNSAKPKVDNNKIVLLGHTHTCKINLLSNGNPKIYLPALCDVSIDQRFETQGFITLDLNFNSINKIADAIIRRMSVNDKIGISMEYVHEYIKK
jgi:predicted phosphodiesterase